LRVQGGAEGPQRKKSSPPRRRDWGPQRIPGGELKVRRGERLAPPPRRRDWALQRIPEGGAVGPQRRKTGPPEEKTGVRRGYQEGGCGSAEEIDCPLGRGDWGPQRIPGGELDPQRRLGSQEETGIGVGGGLCGSATEAGARRGGEYLHSSTTNTLIVGVAHVHSRSGFAYTGAPEARAHAQRRNGRCGR